MTQETIKNFTDLLLGCLELDPKKRFTAEQALQQKIFTDYKKDKNLTKGTTKQLNTTYGRKI